MHKSKKQLTFAVLILALALVVTSASVFARPSGAGLFAPYPGLGTAESFAVLGGSAVTNTGPSVINGNLGVWPNLAVSGFPPGIVTPPGTTHTGDAVAQQAQSDITTAYNTLAGQACDVNLTGMDLGLLNLTPGVYCFSSSAQLSGALTLDAQGDEWSVFIFQIGSTLTTASGSSVNIINADRLCNLHWQVGSSATLGTTTSFQGNIIALDSITLNTGADVFGRVLARNGAVTLDVNEITIPVCELQAEPTATAGPGSTAGPLALPDTGGDQVGPGSQIFQISLGALGLSLILFGVMLSRRTQKVER